MPHTKQGGYAETDPIRPRQKTRGQVNAETDTSRPRQSTDESKTRTKQSKICIETRQLPKGLHPWLYLKKKSTDWNRLTCDEE